MQLMQAQIIEGTVEEITAMLQGGAFAGRRARVILEADEHEDEYESDVATPETIPGVRRGLNQMYRGEGLPAAEVFAAMRRRLKPSDA